MGNPGQNWLSDCLSICPLGIIKMPPAKVRYQYLTEGEHMLTIITVQASWLHLEIVSELIRRIHL